MKLTTKQRLFCDEYIKSGNATDAAVKAGYSTKTAYRTGADNIKKPHVKSYIAKKLKQIEDHKIADAKEVLEFYTRVLRGGETEEVPLALPDRVTVINKKPSVKEKISAAKEIIKRYPLYDPVEKQKLRKLVAETDIAVAQAKIATANDNIDNTAIIVDDVAQAKKVRDEHANSSDNQAD